MRIETTWRGGNTSVEFTADWKTARERACLNLASGALRVVVSDAEGELAIFSVECVR